MVNAQQPYVPKDIVPVFFDIRHLMEGDVQALTHSVGVLKVSLCRTHPFLIQQVPVLHKNPCDAVTFTQKRHKNKAMVCLCRQI